jgi:predicted O-linked N-acetylglucosamine transferase (SPINDLY family)
MSHQELAQQIRGDSIDLLIDLAGHTKNNRLQTFALKPAPVQATWLGYYDTTGLGAMDYIIADRFLIPAGEERYYTERVVRLPRSYLCFTAPEADIEPGPLPAPASGKVTFGCFNNPGKITEAVIACWSSLLRALPGSQLYLKYKAYGDAETRQRFQDAFARMGITPERIRFAGQSPRGEYFQAHQEVDIGLDPFPFNGCATTLNALWMGVPVISLRGSRYVGRMGETLLTNVGLGECVADNEDEYIAKALALTNDLRRLAELRHGLRSQLLKSPLCDGIGFTRELEEAYRDMWKSWCRDRTA